MRYGGFEFVPHLKNVKQNVLDICQYGFTEMLNNAIDHSASNDALVVVEQTYTQIFLSIIDHGVGIFDKIQKDFDLIDARSALLELSKGKLTSEHHRAIRAKVFSTRPGCSMNSTSGLDISSTRVFGSMIPIG